MTQRASSQITLCKKSNACSHKSNLPYPITQQTNRTMNLHLLISAAALAVLSAVAYADTTVEVSPLLDGWKVFLEQYLFPRAHMRSAQPPSTSLAFSHLTIAHTYHHMFVNCHSGACHRQAQRPLGRRLRRSGHPGTLVPSDIMKTYIPCIDTNLLYRRPRNMVMFRCRRRRATRGTRR